MEPQFFSPEVRVSRGRNGAVPVSVALHAMAIAAAVFASAAAPPEVAPIADTTPRIPAMAPPTVRVVPVPPIPPKGNPKGGQAPKRAATPPPPSSAAPAPSVAAPRQIADLDTLTDGPDLPIGPGIATASAPCLVACGKDEGPVEGDGPGDGPVRVRTGINAPQRIHMVPPRYPAIAVQAGLQGDVVLDCVIAPDGHVREARVLSGNPLLQAAALDAVRQWRYTRPRLNDTPIAVLLTVTVHFRLQRR